MPLIEIEGFKEKKRARKAVSERQSQFYLKKLNCRYNRKDIDLEEEPGHSGDMRLWDSGEGWSGWKSNYWRDDYRSREDEDEARCRGKCLTDAGSLKIISHHSKQH